MTQNIPYHVLADPEKIKKIEQAGKIAAEALQYGKSLIKPGVLLLDVATKVEKKIFDMGGKLAFPVNISLNQTAAHYTPIPQDKSVFTDEIIKLDVGAHVDGFIGDNALTVDLSNQHSDLVKASRDALNAAIKTIRVGVTLGEIGKAIQETIESSGFKPIKNLSGHGLGEYEQHSGISIPNYNTGDTTELNEGQHIAIEPFATNGIGLIVEKGNPFIYSQVIKKPVRSQITREVLKLIESYKGLPFATRWITDKYPLFKANFAIRELTQINLIRGYAPLVEKRDGLVSQAEHSLIVGDKPKITTKID
ncbi:type II methionyl aminopeptidase [Candidatus Woesearchaeota archaeon]|jgi:methionyl aminopeptidase|nr:type II methionyl aminopeptidase [Candidatus Woesearchaeota archaeon]